MFELRIDDSTIQIQDLAELKIYLDAGKISQNNRIKRLGETKWQRVSDLIAEELLQESVTTNKQKSRNSPRKFQVRCPSCKSAIQAKESQSSQILECPSCHKRVRLPAKIGPDAAQNSPNENPPAPALPKVESSKIDSSEDDSEYFDDDYESTDEQYDEFGLASPDLSEAEEPAPQYKSQPNLHAGKRDVPELKSTATQYLTPLSMPSPVSLSIEAFQRAIVFVCTRPFANVSLQATILLASLFCIAVPLFLPLLVVIAIGQLRLVRRMMDHESATIADLLTFLRHGWASIWHLFTLVVASILTVAALLSISMILLMPISIIGELSQASSASAAVKKEVVTPDWSINRRQDNGIIGNVTAFFFNTFAEAAGLVGVTILIGILLFPLCYTVIVLTTVLLDIADSPPSPMDYGLVVDAIQRFSECGLGLLARLCIPALLLTFVTAGFFTLFRLLVGSYLVWVPYLQSVAMIAATVSLLVLYSFQTAFSVAVAMQLRVPNKLSGRGTFARSRR